MFTDEQLRAAVKARAASAASKSRTRQQAINAMCKQCIYDPRGGDGTWRQQTEACDVTSCPLHEYRPVSQPHK